MSTNIVQVPFHGDTLDAIQDERGVWVGVKRACENVGLAYGAQHVKLRSQPWAVVSMIETTGADGKKYEMLMVHLDCLPMWLATVDVNRVREDVRPKLIAYQRECARVLRDHFFGKPATLDVATIAAVVSAAMQPMVAMMSQVLDRLQSRSFEGEHTIGTPGARIVSKRLSDYALAMAAGDKRLARSIRGAADMDLRAALGHTGTGRTWATFPAARWTDLRARLEELDRLAGRVGKAQLALIKS
jgi:hypothetical protein